MFILYLLAAVNLLQPEQGRWGHKAKVNVLTATSRLEGLVPMAKDWHIKVTLLKVGYNYYLIN